MSPRRYELSDFEWSIIQPLLPNKPCGVPRVDDRRVLNGIYWRLRTGSPWADIPERYGPATTCADRFRRWATIGVWDRIFATVSAAYDGDLQMIDASLIRVHQHAGNVRAVSARHESAGFTRARRSDSGWRLAWMGKPLSMNLRSRALAAVAERMSGRAGATGVGWRPRR